MCLSYCPHRPDIPGEKKESGIRLTDISTGKLTKFNRRLWNSVGTETWSTVMNERGILWTKCNQLLLKVSEILLTKIWTTVMRVSLVWQRKTIKENCFVCH